MLPSVICVLVWALLWRFRREKTRVPKLEIPVMTDEVKRDSSLYKSYRNVAEKIKAEFDAMGGLA